MTNRNVGVEYGRRVFLYRQGSRWVGYSVGVLNQAVTASCRTLEVNAIL